MYRTSETAFREVNKAGGFHEHGYYGSRVLYSSFELTREHERRGDGTINALNDLDI